MDIFKEYCKLISTLNPTLVDVILKAAGINVDSKVPTISWDNFLFLNSLIKYNTASKDDFIQFFKSIFDPQHKGHLEPEEFNEKVTEFFASQELDKEDKENSVAAKIRQELIEKGVCNDKGGCEISKFLEAMRHDVIDINVYKNALK